MVGTTGGGAAVAFAPPVGAAVGAVLGAGVGVGSGAWVLDGGRLYRSTPGTVMIIGDWLFCAAAGAAKAAPAAAAQAARPLIAIRLAGGA